MKLIILALLTGVLLALGWPTYGFPGLLFIGFVPLLLAEFQLRTKGGKKTGQVFLLSYLAFFTWNIITTNWLYFSTPFGMWFAVLANTLLMSLVFLGYHIIAKRVNFLASSTFLITLWICFEKLHLNWEFSWPWLNLGNGFSSFTSWIQWYEYTGTFGGTLWVLLVNLSIFKFALLYIQHKDKGIIYRGILKNLLLIFIPIGISFIIKNAYTIDKSNQLEAVILQPNIDPYKEKYNTNDKKVGELLVNLAEKKVTDKTEIVVAPETVFADGTRIGEFNFSDASFYSNKLITKYQKLNFLGGVSFLKWIKNKNETNPQSNFYKKGLWYNDYNSAFLLNQEQQNPQFYHKSKLVVGVENFPYQSTLKPILGDVMIDLGGTVAMKTTQTDREVFQLTTNQNVAPIICYESVYGEYVTGYVKNKADFLAIITNDAWWGDTQGHQQHLSYARLRAIETRRDVVRSANTGISAIINQKGDITQSLGYEKRGSLKGTINLSKKQTFYVRFGDYIARVAQFLSLFIFLFAVAKSRKSV